jgi:hypothetical protein
MRPDDGSPADMRRRFATPGAGSPPLDEDTLDRLLAGDLPPHDAPPGYAEVAALLAATVAPPRPEELTGQAAVLAELRAVTRARTIPARARRTGRRSRRRLGLAVVAVAGALATGGAAAAAGGHIPEPVRNAAHSILVSVGGADPATPVAPPTGDGTGPGATAAPSGPEPPGQTGPSSGSRAAGSATSPDTAAPDTERLCRAYLASQDKQTGKKLKAPWSKLLADKAGGADKVLSYCQDLLPEDAKSKEGKQKTPPNDQGQGQRGSPPSTGGGQGRTVPPSTRTSR